MRPPTERTYAEISVAALRHNLDTVKTLSGGKRIIAVAKANAYGHGIAIVKVILDKIACLAVATFEEGCLLRRFYHDIPILLLGYVPTENIAVCAEKRLAVTLYDEEAARTYSAALAGVGKTAYAHLKLDVGMHRNGLAPEDEAAMARIARLPGLRVDGIYTHYADAPERDEALFSARTRRFLRAVAVCEGMGYRFTWVHASNTAAASRAVGNAVRVGYALYGYGLSGLKPALTWKARVARVFPLQKGETLGYGGTYQAQDTVRVAVVCVGYGDGYPRALSNVGNVLYDGVFLPVIGRVCMDYIFIDATHSRVSRGDYVTLIGESNEKQITAEDLGFGYEVLTGIGERVKRVVR